MASTDVLDSTNDLFKLASKLQGNSTMFRLTYATSSFDSDANKTPAAATYQSPIIKVTSSVSLTATRNFVLPLTQGAILFVYNSTTGGQSIQFIGSSGTGATIANGKHGIIYCDGTNWIELYEQP